MSVAIAVIIIIVCLIFESFFSGSEISLISVDRIKLRLKVEAGSKSAAKVDKMLKDPEEIFGTTATGTNLAVVIAVSVATVTLVSRYGHRGELYATLIMSPIILLVGEIIPKSIFQEYADTLAYIMIYPISIAKHIFSPLLYITSKATNFLIYLITGKENNAEHFMSREEMIQILLLGGKRLDLPEDEIKMIHNIFEFGETTVRECMVPLINLVTLNENSSISLARKVFMESQYSRIPVYKDRGCNIFGILRYSDLIKNRDKEGDISSLVTPAYFVPKTKQVKTLLKELQELGIAMAVVVNEYGGTTGVVTIEDMLEEIVGEIEDEYDEEGDNALFKKLPDGSILIEGKMEIDSIQEELDIEIPEGDYETIGGFLTDKMQKIPAKGETLEDGGLLFQVLESDARHINKIKMSRIEPIKGKEGEGGA
ncbi:MAG: hemolysin family protein [Nitrospinota bacterium]|nr:hemolysin family protein [Nitrospinota bacterium]